MRSEERGSSEKLNQEEKKLVRRGSGEKLKRDRDQTFSHPRDQETKGVS